MKSSIVHFRMPFWAHNQSGTEPYIREHDRNILTYLWDIVGERDIRAAALRAAEDIHANVEFSCDEFTPSNLVPLLDDRNIYKVEYKPPERFYDGITAFLHREGSFHRIELMTGLPPEVEAFALAHEIGHTYFPQFGADPQGFGNVALEMFCDMFAAGILLEKYKLRQEIDEDEIVDASNIMFITDLALINRVSTQCAFCGLWLYDNLNIDEDKIHNGVITFEHVLGDYGPHQLLIDYTNYH